MRWLLVFLLLVLCVGCVNLADKLVLWPPPAEPAPGARRVVIAGGVEVFVDRNLEAEPRAFALRFYGNGELANRVAEDVQLADIPLEMWGVNYSGYGGSAGHATLANVARSALAAYDALAVRARGRPIIVVGNSLGTAAALHVAAHRKVAGVVLQNPTPLREVIRSHGWWNLWLLAWPVSLQVPGELDSIANAKRATAPAVFVSARRDSIVPVRLQQRVMDAYRGDWRVLDVDGDHNDPVPAAVRQAVRARVDEMIGATLRPQ